MSEQEYSVQAWNSGNEGRRNDLCSLIAELGYEIDTMSAHGVTRLGYHEIQLDESGKRIFSSQTKRAFTVLKPWASPEHFQAILPYLVPSPASISIEAYLEKGELVIPGDDIRIAFARIQSEETE